MVASYPGRPVRNALIESARGRSEEKSYDSVALMSLLMSAGGELSVTSDNGNPESLRSPSMTSVNDGFSGVRPFVYHESANGNNGATWSWEPNWGGRTLTASVIS